MECRVQVDRYNKPSDNYDTEKWNFDGIVEDAEPAFKVGCKLSTSGVFPGWKSGSEFMKLRK
jgi:hypothetical protein